MDRLQLEKYVVSNGLVTQDQLQIACRDSEKSGRKLADVLVAHDFLSPLSLNRIEGQLQGLKTLELNDVEPEPEALALLTSEQVRALLVLPISIMDDIQTTSSTERQLVIAMESAHDVTVVDRLNELFNGAFQLDIRLASRADISNAIDRFYGVELFIDTLLGELDLERTADSDSIRSLSSINQMSELLDGGTVESREAPVVRLVDAMLHDAVRRRASDLHFEPERSFLRIRYRLDGVLTQIRSIHIDYWSSMLVRLKVLCGLDISETRMAQDGRMTLNVIGRELDIRVSCFPCVYGECLVLRLLDCYASLRPLLNLGIAQEQAEQLAQLIRKPQGLVMVTGPTGSGKSTTLYSLVNEIRSEKINIVTMEDPVEYRLPLVRQCSVNAALKLDFANGVRSILRQDPDVILVGETRDLPTAEMVVKAVLSGHLVMTTLHAHSALGAVTRLRELGINTSQLSGLILALIAQRLLRLLCQVCKVPDVDQAGWYTPIGCAVCGGIGYRGRIPILEIVCPDQETNFLISAHSDPLDSSTPVFFNANTGLLPVACRLLNAGLTSVEEICRVLGCTRHEIESNTVADEGQD